MIQNNAVYIKATWIGQVCGGVDGKTIPSSTRSHDILEHGGLYCGPHYSSAKVYVTP